MIKTIVDETGELLFVVLAGIAAVIGGTILWVVSSIYATVDEWLHQERA